MFEPCRVIAYPEENATKMWNPDDQVAHRIGEILKVCRIVKRRIETGEFHLATRGLKAISRLANEALDERAKGAQS